MKLTDVIYSSSPIYLQNLFCSLYGTLEKRKRFSNHFFYYLDWLEESQFWGEQEIYDYKLRELQRIYQHAYNTVPFYKERYKKAGLPPDLIKDLEDFKKIPVLNKEDIHENPRALLSVNNPDGKPYALQTSGTSGKAMDFYLTKRAISYQWAVWWRFRMRFGINFGDKSLNFIGKPVVPLTQENPPFWRVNKPLNQHLVNMQHIKPKNIKYFVDYINNEQFIFFSGYPNILYTFCTLVENLGLKIIHPPKLVFTGAEKLMDNQKACIERVLDCVATDQYGFSEAAGNASKCEFGIFHEDFEFGHLEVNNPIHTATTITGEILATGFSNYGMPLLRYNVGDFGTWSSKKCKCGRHSDTIISIDGRNEDVIITPEGAAMQLHSYFYKGMNEIEECQAVQYKLGEMTIRIVKRDNYKQKVEELLLKRVKKWISPSIKVNFEYMGRLERTANGKLKMVVSYLNEERIN